jgi:hypothetical protein
MSWSVSIREERSIDVVVRKLFEKIEKIEKGIIRYYFGVIVVGLIREVDFRP